MDHISRVGLFLEVVKHQSFAGAARAVGMTGPALSKQVQSLEDQLGVRLLNRTTRQVSLTEEGAIYSERARQALEDLQEAEHQVQEMKACPTGVLKISAPVSFGHKYLTKPIVEFAKQYPDVKLDVDYDDRHVDMMAEGYDVVIRIGAMEDSSHIARKLADCPIVLCASPELIAEYGMPEHPEDVAKYPALTYTRQGYYDEWRYKNNKTGETGVVALDRHLSANNAEVKVEACLQGVGISSMPIFTVIEHIQAGRLVHLFPECTIYPERYIYAMFPQNRHLSTKTRLFVDMLTMHSKNFPWN